MRICQKLPQLKANLIRHEKHHISVYFHIFFFSLRSFKIDSKMDEIKASAKIEFANLISLALEKSLPWSYLFLIVDKMSLDQGQFKNIIKVLLKELQQLQAKFQGKEEKEFSENLLTKSSLEKAELEIAESDVTFDSDVESMKDISENKVSIIDPVDKETPNVSFKEIDNEWYTFVSNDKKSDSETEKAEESERIIVEQVKKSPYQCTFCYKSFQKSSNWKRHERIHTREVPYECKTCKKRFNQRSNLKKHEMIHTGEVPYECKTCKKRFNDKGNLMAHERIHTGEVPYECKTCKKRFKRKADLKTHVRIHTGEEPYECETCKKKFKRKDHLKSHGKIHS